MLPDGSDHSRRAFDVAARLRRPGDHVGAALCYTECCPRRLTRPSAMLCCALCAQVLVSHVFDNTKTYLPPKFKPEFIKSYVQLLVVVAWCVCVRECVVYVCMCCVWLTTHPLFQTL